MHERCAFLSCLLLVSCAVGDEPTPRDPSVEIPETWTATDDVDRAPPPQRWWESFDAPHLNATIDDALGRNLQLGVAAARLDAALSRAKIAGADLWPQVQARLDASRRRQNFIGLPIPGSNGVLSNINNSFGVSLDVSWELDLWGRLRAASDAADATLAAAAADTAGVQQSIAAQTAKAWIATIAARQQLNLATETATNLQRSAGRIRDRFQRGVRTALDVRLAETDAENASALVELRARQLDAACRQLQVLAGRYPDAQNRDRDTWPSSLPVPGSTPPAGIPLDVLRRRPDLVAQERRLAAADSDLNVAQASLYPRISLTASGGTASEDVADLLDTDFRVWSLASNLTAPIFQAGRLRENVKLQDARRREALILFHDALLQALREVEQALAAEEFLAREERHRIAEAEAAGSSRSLSEDRYDRGLIDVITLLGAQRRALSARSAAIDARRARLDNRIDLFLALGGGFGAQSEPNGESR